MLKNGLSSEQILAKAPLEIAKLEAREKAENNSAKRAAIRAKRKALENVLAFIQKRSSKRAERATKNY